MKSYFKNIYKYLSESRFLSKAKGSYLSKLIFFLLLISFLIPLTVQGQGVTIENPLRAQSFWDLIDKLIDFIFYLAIAVAPIMFIVAGFYFITAAGDPEKINTAKKMILWVLIGLLIVFLAKALIVFFGEMFGIQIPPTTP